MITKRQHQALWDNIRRLCWFGMPVSTHTGLKVKSCSMEDDGCSINLEDGTRITHRSYQEGTTYGTARAKFRVVVPLCKLRIYEVGMEFDKTTGKFKDIKVE